MVRLRRIKAPRLEACRPIPLVCSVSGRIILGFGLLVLILIVVVAGAARLVRQHQTDVALMDGRVEIARLLVEGALDSALTNLFTERYIVTGDEQLPPLINSRAAQVEENIAQVQALERAQEDELAFQEGELARLDELEAGAAALSETVENVIALRRAGDELGARAVMEADAPAIAAFGSNLVEASDDEHDEVSEFRALANATGDRSFWLLIVSGAIGAALGLAAATFITRSILKPLSAVESVALAVAEGDLEARAPATGPRELARLGASLNRMTDSLLQFNRSLEQSVKERTKQLQGRTKQLQAISEAMATYLDSGNWNEASATILRSALRQTESEYGFLGVVVEGPALRILAHEGIVWDAVLNRELYDNAMRTYQEVGYLEFTNFDNLFGKVITEGKTLLTNEPAADPRSGGLPPGHPPLNRFLGVPIFRGSDVVGIIGVANRPGGYGGEEQGKIEILTQAAGVLYENYRQRQREAALEFERRRAEEALQRSEAMYRDLVETSQDLIFQCDADGRLTFLNKAWENTHGYGIAEMLGKPFTEFMTPEVAQRDMEEFGRLMAGGSVTGFETTHISKSGNEIHLLFNAIPLLDGGGRIFGTQGTAHDITERKRAEEALRESEERARQIMNQAVDAIFLADHQGKIIDVNRAACDSLGYTREELLSLSVADIADGFSPEMLAQTGKRMASGVPITLEGIHRRKDGTTFPVEIRIGMLDVGGRPHMLGLARDITDRKRAEEELLESRQMLGEIAEGITDGILLLSKDFKVLWANKAAMEQSHNALEELIGNQCYKVSHRRDSPCEPPNDPCPIYQLQQAGEPVTVTHTHINANGEKVFVEVAAHPIRNEKGETIKFVHVSRDVTERKRAEEALRQLNEQLSDEHRQIEELNRTLEAKVEERTSELRLANEEMRERNHQLLDARAQAATDALTGLWNHRSLQERVRDEVQRSHQNGNKVSLIMLDIDGFKRVNDSLGHQAGDQILREIADGLTDTVGPEKAYRYGGDEFAVLLPGADRRSAARIAERIRRDVETRSDDGPERTTVSLGVASLSDMSGSAEELIYGADAAMYWAKSAGKNRVGEWGKLVKGRTKGSLPWYAADRAVKAPDVVAALVAALAAKDPDTAAHTERCSWYAARLSKELGLEKEDASIVRLASLLHDIGKLAIPDKVLLKSGPLNDDEWAMMKQHPSMALHVLGQIRSITDITPAILHHHENFDGSGYPDGLAGDDIPTASRILLVADAFDAMTTDRPYRKALPVETAIEELKRNSGTQFDPTVVDAFLRVLDRHGPEPLRFMSSRRNGRRRQADRPKIAQT